MTVLPDALGVAPEQHVDEVAGAEALVLLAPQAHHGRQQLLGGHRAVERLGRRQAGVAVAARRRRLPEVSEQLHAPALDRLAEGEHRVEVLRLPPLVSGVAVALLDHAALLHDILQSVGQPRRRRQAVAAGAPGLLVVALDALGQVEVGDEPHVGLVDAHAEGDRRDHHDAVFAQEPRLVARARGRVETRVIRQRLDALGHERVGRLLDRRARQAVDDAGVARDARCAAASAAAPAAGSCPRCGTGCWGGRSWRRTAARRSAAIGSGSRGASRRSRSRSARCAARSASARAAPRAAGSRGGSRAPTATRSAPRRWRTARCGARSSSDSVLSSLSRSGAR